MIELIRSRRTQKISPYFCRRLFEYNETVLNDYLMAISKLPWKKVTKNMEASHYSIKEIFIHILAVYNGWLNYIVYDRGSEIPYSTEHNPRRYHSIRDVRKFKNKVLKGVNKLLKNLDEELLAKKVNAPWLPGSHKIADALMQVTFEQAHHIGEIISLFYQLDIEPPEMTWIMTPRKL